uniref:L1 transposable element dsRBD-like domain-containing protein n=1 Tax=Canis lupus familiaris TaxID=9615 RepID=A0A8C0QPK3_CANLF
RRLRSRERESNSAGPRAQGAGDTARDPASPRDRQRPGGPRTPRTLLPELSRVAAPPPGASRPCRGSASEFLWGLNPGFLAAAATVVLPPAASRGKQPLLSPAPGREQSSSPKCQHLKFSTTGPSPRRPARRTSSRGSQGLKVYRIRRYSPRGFFFFFLISVCFPPPFFPFHSFSFSFSFSSLFSFFLPFFFFLFLFSFLLSLFLLFPIQLVFGHSALSKMTRRKNSPQKKESETVLSPTELQNLDYNSMSESQFRSTIIQLLVADLSTETWQARKGWQDIFRVLNEKNMQPRILYPARLSFKMEGEIKSFQDRQELKEYVTSKPALQEILRGALKIPL